MPGGVHIHYVKVDGGLLEMPILANISRSEDEEEVVFYGSGAGSGSGSETLVFDFDSDDPDYFIILSTFTVTFNVLDCAYGITPLVGSYVIEGDGSMTAKVEVEQIARGSLPVTGTFSLSIGGREVPNIAADIDAATLEAVLEINFPDEGGEFTCACRYSSSHVTTV